MPTGIAVTRVGYYQLEFGKFTSRWSTIGSKKAIKKAYF